MATEVCVNKIALHKGDPCIRLELFVVQTLVETEKNNQGNEKYPARFNTVFIVIIN